MGDLFHDAAVFGQVGHGLLLELERGHVIVVVVDVQVVTLVFVANVEVVLKETNR
jgi:hypothetical protein